METSVFALDTLNSEEGSKESAAELMTALADAAAQRAERALTLVREGAIEAMTDGRYRVRSGGGGWYAVREGYCNCPDFAWRGFVPCKHILAVQIARRVEQAAA